MVSTPHGGAIVNRVLKNKVREKILESLKEFTKINVDQMRAYDIENIAFGVYTPIEGFMGEEDVSSVLNNIRLDNDIIWSIPIILDVDENLYSKLTEGEEIILVYDNIPLAIMQIEEKYVWDKKTFVEKLFKTKDPNHPGVKYYLSMKDYLIAGEIDLINEIPGDPWIIRPKEARLLFKERKWKSIVAFQTRNVPHIGHEFLVKSALNFVDGAFINPVIGKKKKGDWRDEVIKDAWEKLFNLYFPKNTAILGFLRYVMRYAGPREALHHAIMRKNIGATHFIIGRDHAGVGNYYTPYEAQEFVKQFEEELGIDIITFKELYWCNKCRAVVNDKICPHDEIYKIRFSGTLIRKVILEGKTPDERIFRKEILEVIRKYEKPFVE